MPAHQGRGAERPRVRELEAEGREGHRAEAASVRGAVHARARSQGHEIGPLQLDVAHGDAAERRRIRAIKTLDYHAEGGTIQVDGQPCTLTKYRIQANYQIPGYRAQIECTRANGQKYKNVETMSGDYAWDEDIPGAELVPGKGKATPKPAALEERRIRLWASPHGAAKAAIAGAAGLPPTESFGQNPAVAARCQAAAGVKATTTLAWQGDKAVVTYPIPGVAGATATATLDNLPAGTGCREARDEQDGVRLQQFRRTSTIRCSRSRRCMPARSSNAGTAPSFAS